MKAGGAAYRLVTKADIAALEKLAAAGAEASYPELAGVLNGRITGFAALFDLPDHIAACTVGLDGFIMCVREKDAFRIRWLVPADMGAIAIRGLIATALSAENARNKLTGTETVYGDFDERSALEKDASVGLARLFTASTQDIVSDGDKLATRVLAPASDVAATLGVAL